MLLPNVWKLFWNLIFINVTVPRGCEKNRFNSHETLRDHQDFLRTQNKKVIDYQEFISISVIQRTLLSSIHQLWIDRIAVLPVPAKISLPPRGLSL